VLCSGCCRRYAEYHAERIESRAQFRRQHRRRRGHRAEPFPPELAEPLPFARWLEAEVAADLQRENANPPAEDVVQLCTPPSNRATKFRSMWAFGNHIRVAAAETHLKTCDSGVAATFRRPCRAGLRDHNPVIADIEYVGNVQEIVELNYGRLCVVVLMCS
jgi:hypothetical protein